MGVVSVWVWCLRVDVVSACGCGVCVESLGDLDALCIWVMYKHCTCCANKKILKLQQQ